jgi:hypothetical protein
MSDRHLVIGAGPVGRQAFSPVRGSEVVVATRSRTDTDIP